MYVGIGAHEGTSEKTLDEAEPYGAMVTTGCQRCQDPGISTEEDCRHGVELAKALKARLLHSAADAGL